VHVTQQQYKRIIGLASRSATPAPVEPEKVLQALGEVARVARRGHLQEAETIVSYLPLEGPLGPATLDLKARICAQQGRLIEAQLCWMEAVRQSPGNESYRRSLHYVTHVLRPSRLPVLMSTVAVAMLVIMALVLAGVVGRL